MSNRHTSKRVRGSWLDLGVLRASLFEAVMLVWME